MGNALRVLLLVLSLAPALLIDVLSLIINGNGPQFTGITRLLIGALREAFARLLDREEHVDG